MKFGMLFSNQEMTEIIENIDSFEQLSARKIFFNCISNGGKSVPDDDGYISIGAYFDLYTTCGKQFLLDMSLYVRENAYDVFRRMFPQYSFSYAVKNDPVEFVKNQRMFTAILTDPDEDLDNKILTTNLIALNRFFVDTDHKVKIAARDGHGKLYIIHISNNTYLKCVSICEQICLAEHINNIRYYVDSLNNKIAVMVSGHDLNHEGVYMEEIDDILKSKKVGFYVRLSKRKRKQLWSLTFLTNRFGFDQIRNIGFLFSKQYRITYHDLKSGLAEYTENKAEKIDAISSCITESFNYFNPKTQKIERIVAFGIVSKDNSLKRLIWRNIYKNDTDKDKKISDICFNIYCQLQLAILGA